MKSKKIIYLKAYFLFRYLFKLVFINFFSSFGTGRLGMAGDVVS